MSNKNFKITAKEDNKEYWISRAVAVVVCVETEDADSKEPLYLVSKRGDGCPDFKGLWQLTCGYLDWGETILEAAERELYEELGLEFIDRDFKWNLRNIVTNPEKDGRQNIIFRFHIEVPYELLKEKFNNGSINANTKSRGGEDNEIVEIKLVKHSEIDNYEWAFNHGEILKEWKVRESKNLIIE